MENFQPAWWCPGLHAQTIFARFFRPQPKIVLKRIHIETPDQDFLDLDLLEGDSVAPLVVILHGLEGCSTAPYVTSLLGEIQKAGWRAAAMNFRGCSGEPNRLKSSYHSGKSEDLETVVRYFLDPNRRGGFETRPYQGEKNIYLIGFSAGGNIILKWLGEKSESVPPQIKKAVAVSVPYDLAKAVEFLDKGWNREIYARALLWSLKAKICQKEKRFPDFVNIGKVREAKTFRAFDHLVTAPLNGFQNEEEYWRLSSSFSYLEKIRVPALLIHAKDDPFFPAAYFPYEKIQANPFLKLRMTEQGGHLGFVSGPWPWKQKPWLEKTILEFLSVS